MRWLQLVAAHQCGRPPFDIWNEGEVVTDPEIDTTSPAWRTIGPRLSGRPDSADYIQGEDMTAKDRHFGRKTVMLTCQNLYSYPPNWEQATYGQAPPTCQMPWQPLDFWSPDGFKPAAGASHHSLSAAPVVSASRHTRAPGIASEPYWSWLSSATANVTRYQDYLLSTLRDTPVSNGSSGSQLELYNDFLLDRGAFAPKED